MRPGRLAGIDGLRAIAVISVVLFHAKVVGSELGWAGVELFFVVSGFLITRILLQLRPHPRYLQIFYMRRALRILPVYYFVLIVSVLLAVGAGVPLSSLDVPFYLVYVQNYFPQIPTAMDGGIPLTSHTWTLAVEEQFYWVWPLVILVLRARPLSIVVVGCVVGAPIARLAMLLATDNPYATIATLPAQVDALGVGAALALAERARVAPRLVRTCAIVAIAAGSALLAFLVATSGGPAAFANTSVWAASSINALTLSAFASVFGGVVALTSLARGGALRILEWRPLVHLGRISYGLYLYNPLALLVTSLILAWSGRRSAAEAGPGEVMLGTAVTYALALASWRYLETPFLRLRGSAPAITAEADLPRLLA